MAELRTRIVLRNDSSANWLTNEDVVLLKGEVGIEFVGDKVKMKVGDGTKTWEQLPYFGGEEAKTFTVGALSEITDTELTVGDTAVVKTVIYEDEANEANNKYSYTGYVWNGQAWAAMDGNYNAKNVYFDSDMTVTKTFGKYVCDSSNPNKTIASEGMSVYDLIMDAYSESKDPSKTNPKVSSFSVTGNGNSATAFEIGTTVTPQWASTFNSGSYTYKSTASKDSVSPVSGTGVSATSWTVKQGDTQIGTVEDGTAASSFVIGDGNTTAVSGSVTYSVVAGYSNGNYALTNLNTLPKTDVRITAGSTTAVTDTLTWNRKMFGKGTTAATLDSATIRGMKSANASAVASTAPFEFAAVAGDTKVVFAYPKAMTTATPKFEIFTMAWGATEGFTSSEVQVADARGTNEDGTLNNAMTYTVWTYAPAGGFAAAETKYRVYF